MVGLNRCKKNLNHINVTYVPTLIDGHNLAKHGLFVFFSSLNTVGCVFFPKTHIALNIGFDLYARPTIFLEIEFDLLCLLLKIKERLRQNRHLYVHVA